MKPRSVPSPDSRWRHGWTAVKEMRKQTLLLPWSQHHKGGQTVSRTQQWLVKRAIETKEEMGDYIRSYSVSQFQKTYSLPEDDDFLKRKEKAVKTVVDLSDVYKPHRKYKRQQGAEELLDEESQIHATLLEYGRVTDSLM
nr:coiled-coil domain-containing protein 93-like isoform X2 [Equus asinus]